MKVLLDQLREQFMGKLTIWDEEVEAASSSNSKVMMRNLRTNLAHCLRENLRLKTQCCVSKQGGAVLEDTVRRVVFDILRGLK